MVRRQKASALLVPEVLLPSGSMSAGADLHLFSRMAESHSSSTVCADFQDQGLAGDKSEQQSLEWNIAFNFRSAQSGQWTGTVAANVGGWH